MKRQLTILAAVAALGAFTTSCDKDTEGLTGVTYYAVITLDGDTYMNWQAGTPFVDPGYSAEMEGENITDQVVVSTSMNQSDPQPGVYSITYSAVNADGFSASATRYVCVCSDVGSAEGYYMTDPASYRIGSATVAYGGSYPVYILWDEDCYYCSDFLGGWYQYRAGYGVNYSAPGYFDMQDNVITLIDSYVAGWGDSLDDLTDATYDPEAGTIHWDASYAGMEFVQTLIKNK